MKSLTPIAALALLSTALLPPASRSAPQEGDSPALLAAVPPDAILFFSAHDLAGLRADAGESSWGRMFADPEMKELWDWLGNEFKQQMEEDTDGLSGRDMDLFLESMQGSAVFFVTGESLDAPELGFLFQPGAGRESFEEFVALAEDTSDKEWTYDEYAGVSLNIGEEAASDQRPASTDVEFELDGIWGGVNSPSTENAIAVAHGMIDRLQGNDETSVLSSTLLASARAGSFPGRFELFADARRLFSGLPDLNELDDQQRQVLELLGLPDITWLHATGDLGKGERLDLHLRMPAPESGYLEEWLAALGPAPLHLAALAPTDAISATLYNIDVFAIYESAWDLFSDVAPEEYEQMRAAFEGGLESLGGLDLEGDLLAQLTGEFAGINVKVPAEEFEAAAGLGSLGFDIPEDLQAGEVGIFGLEDAETVELFLEELLNTVGMMMGVSAASIEAEDFQGFTVNTLELPMVEGGLSWCFTDDYVIGSMYPSALRSVLALHGKQDAPSILTNELYAPHLEQHAGAWMLSLAPSETTTRMLFGLAEMIAGMGGEPAWDNLELEEQTDWPFDDVPLPDPELASRYLEGTMIFKCEHAPRERMLEIGFMAR